MALKYLFKQGGENEPTAIQAPQPQISAAALQVLNLPELLEEIILYDLSTISIGQSRTQPRHWNKGWVRLNQLRGVSKGWSSIIDHSPKLGKIVFRYPVTSCYIKIERLSLCEPFLCSLGDKMKEMSEIKNFKGASTLEEFEIFTSSLAPLAGYVSSNVFVSQPAVEAVFIRFSGLANASWLRDYEAYVRPVDYSRVSSTQDYCYHYKVVNYRGGGVTAEDLVSSLMVVICKFFSFDGQFRNLTIDLAVGNLMSSNNSGFLSIVTSRRLWEPMWPARRVSRTPINVEERGGAFGTGSKILKRISGVFSRS
ncbi:hypothetical protein TWF718_009202 [Orbilia javanica]|uniref:Uncharacterized protein n=1 Tax=Orbilia javanica TaxID=47235 RepID=A0AAN8MP48_9PEZI